MCVCSHYFSEEEARSYLAGAPGVLSSYLGRSQNPHLRGIVLFLLARTSSLNVADKHMQMSPADAPKYYTTNVFPLVDLDLPKNPAELRAIIPTIRKEWIRDHFRGAQAQASLASDAERPMYSELAKCAVRCYRYLSPKDLLLVLLVIPMSRSWIHQPKGDEALSWNLFWGYYLQHWAEMGDSPDLCYHYAMCGSMQFTMKTSDRTI